MSKGELNDKRNAEIIIRALKAVEIQGDMQFCPYMMMGFDFVTLHGKNKNCQYIKQSEGIVLTGKPAIRFTTDILKFMNQ